MSSQDQHANLDMTKAADAITSATTATSPTSLLVTSPTSLPDTPDGSVKNEKKKRSIIPRIFSSKRSGRRSSESEGEGEKEVEKKISERKKAFIEAAPIMRKSFSERQSSPGIQSLNLSNFEENSMLPSTDTKEFRIFVATWNVAGKSPNNGLNLEDFLQVEGSSDIYVLGFQEIVPLSAGNVLVIEDNEPAAKWLTLIDQALYKPQNSSTVYATDSPAHNSTKASHNNLNFFQKPSLKVISKVFKEDSRILKSCNCPIYGVSISRKTADTKTQ